jgi:hypothetical protein
VVRACGRVCRGSGSLQAREGWSSVGTPGSRFPRRGEGPLDVPSRIGASSLLSRTCWRPNRRAGFFGAPEGFEPRPRIRSPNRLQSATCGFPQSPCSEGAIVCAGVRPVVPGCAPVKSHHPCPGVWPLYGLLRPAICSDPTRSKFPFQKYLLPRVSCRHLPKGCLPLREETGVAPLSCKRASQWVRRGPFLDRQVCRQ